MNFSTLIPAGLVKGSDRSATEKISGMIQVLLFFDELIVIATFFELIRMVLFQKTWRVLSDGTLPGTLKAGKYNVGVVGIIRSYPIRRPVVHVETSSGVTLEMNFHFMSWTGLSKFRMFSKIASFQIDTQTNLKVEVSNITPSDIKSSRLILKRLLFGRNVKRIEIVINPRFNYTKFLILIVIHVGASCLLFLQR